MRFLNPLALLVVGALSLAPLALPTDAYAEPTGTQEGDHGGEHGDAHGEDSHKDGAHGEEAHGDAHGGEHGEGHGGHHALTAWGDDNGNGTPNFLDTEDDHFANSWGMSVPMQWGAHLINLLILVGGLAFLARKPIAAALRDRSLDIQKQLDESAEKEAEARARHEELERRLSGFEAEVAQMRQDAENAANTERGDIANRAQEAAVRIGEAAERAIRDETARARRELRAEAVELAVQLAEETLRNQVGTADRQRLAQDLLTSLGAQGGKHG